jgi:hypothetical protein
MFAVVVAKGIYCTLGRITKLATKKLSLSMVLDNENAPFLCSKSWHNYSKQLEKVLFGNFSNR